MKNISGVILNNIEKREFDIEMTWHLSETPSSTNIHITLYKINKMVILNIDSFVIPTGTGTGTVAVNGYFEWPIHLLPKEDIQLTGFAQRTSNDHAFSLVFLSSLNSPNVHLYRFNSTNAELIGWVNSAGPISIKSISVNYNLN